MFSRITNKRAIAVWGHLNQIMPNCTTCGFHVEHELIKTGIYVSLSNIATKMILSKNCLKKYEFIKSIIFSACCCTICKCNIDKLSICTCVNEMINENDVPRYPFFIPSNKKMIATLDSFFKVLRKRAQQKEMGTKIYSKIRHDKMNISKYHVSIEDTKILWDIQNGECYYCGNKLGSLYERSGYQLDHLMPISLDGLHSPLNLVIACNDCNLRKCMKTEEEFLKVLSRTRDDCWLIKRKETITKIKKEIWLAFPTTGDNSS